MSLTLWRDGEPLGIIEVDGDVVDGVPTITLNLVGEVSLAAGNTLHVGHGYNLVRLDVTVGAK